MQAEQIDGSVFLHLNASLIHEMNIRMGLTIRVEMLINQYKVLFPFYMLMFIVYALLRFIFLLCRIVATQESFFQINNGCCLLHLL